MTPTSPAPRGQLAIGEHKELKTADEAIRSAQRLAEKPHNVGALAYVIEADTSTMTTANRACWGGSGERRKRKAVPPLFTIGYERATSAQVIDALQATRVELLVDVRAVGASRRAGFSKSALRASVEEAGVGYLHLRDLGTPKAGRDAARAGRCAEMRAIFSAWLEEPAAVVAMERLAAETESRRVCLLCYEEEPSCCHRQVLAERLVERAPRKVEDLLAAA